MGGGDGGAGSAACEEGGAGAPVGSQAALDLAHEFDLRQTLYVDGANHGPMPRRSLAAAQAALECKRDPSLLDDRLYFALPERIRRAAARLLGAEPTQVALGTGASHGINLVARGLSWRRGDRVLLPRGEFPANRLPWLALRDRGVIVDEVDPERLLEHLDRRTRVVAVGHVNFAHGRRLALEPIGAACEEVGALFVVDAAQSLGVVPFDVGRCRAGVVAAAGYKWLLSPYGTGLTYVADEWSERLRLPWLNWMSVVGAEEFDRLVDLEVRFRPGAARFDVPEPAAFVHGAALANSLEFLAQVGVERIWRHVCALLDRLLADLPPGVRLDSDRAPARSSAIVRLVCPRGGVERVYGALRAAGVALSVREGGLRVAPGVWNTSADVDRLLERLHDVL